jgi:hypothetical protein
MTSTLKSRIGMLAAAAVFFLPVVWSSPRGLTNLVTCGQQSLTPFSVVMDQHLVPTLTTSLAETRGTKLTLCGGLALNMGATAGKAGAVTMHVTLTNDTPHPWRGTVTLGLGSLVLPIRMGEIGPGETTAASETLHLSPGTHQVSGTLLLGP